MKQRYLWLLALLSILTLMSTTTLAIAGEAMTSGYVEIGISGMDTDDSPARVNEYVNTRSEEGFSFAPKFFLESINESSSIDFGADIMGPRDQEFNLEFDAKRIFRFNFDYQVLEHWKDHETLDQMGATAREDTGGAQPSVTTDKIFGELAALPTPVTSVGGVTLPYDAAAAYTQELNNDYIVTRRETNTETSLTLPALPNITFHAGMRIETRQGMEQAIGMSKCDGCHVSAGSKVIDERTEDFTFGATGKFGPLTVEYEYMNRTFDEDGATPTRFYENATNPSANDQLLYEDGYFEYGRTPDSEKDSHLLKARYDFSSNTTLSASYTKADIESDKSEPASDISYSLANDTLKTEFESFGGKLATRFGNLRMSVRANTYSIDADSNIVYRRSDLTTRDDNNLLSFDLDQEWDPAEARDVDEFGIDIVYRLAQGTTARLGYDYENIDRADAELGETETNTFKVSLKSRLSKQLSGRISYKYQDISNPLDNPTGIAQGMGTQDPLNPGLWFVDTANYLGIDNNSATTVWYWNSVYPNRTLEATNLPDTVHEAKFNTTWAPQANLAATLFARIRYEENDDVGYDQTTYVPGISFWYAPSDKVNLTMAYTFSKQDTENRICVGWYHG
ncbi:MAG: MtrB/PioB family outer membrane beta-barrel protein [Desulfuromusa sp.]|nr:MtrB/PioB family outer membrane beta-barrel protein [Desulfuromusa sp.]